MVSKLLPLIPPHTVYVEPFCGGASLLYAKPWPKVSNTHHYREVINDTSEDLVNMYRIARDRPDEFFAMLEGTLFSEAEYKRAGDILRRKVPSDETTRAWAYYVNIQMSFANKLNGGWQRRVFPQNGAATWHMRDLEPHRQRIRSVHITFTDALKCIQQWDSPQTFFYCDPPYPNTDQGHYKGYSVDDFASLIATLDACEGSFMLSCYDVPGAATPFDWERFEFSTVCSGSGKGSVGKGRNKSRAATAEELGDRKRIEVVYRRMHKAPWRPELQKPRDAGAYDCYPGKSLDRDPPTG